MVIICAVFGSIITINLSFYEHVVFPSGTGLFALIFLSVFTAISSQR